MRWVASRRLAGLTVILDQLQDPHNISAVLRSCEIFGVHRVHIVHAVEAEGVLKLNPAVTCGCERWLQVLEYSDTESCLNLVRQAGYRIYVAEPDPGSENLEALDFARPAALVLGAELRGVSGPARAAADAFYHVEMHGFTQSFNVSVAAALSLSIASRRRRACLPAQGDFTPEEQDKLVKEWIKNQMDRRREK